MQESCFICLQSGHNMKKILLSLLLLTLSEQAVHAESPEYTIQNEEIPYKNIILGAIYLKKYSLAKSTIELNQLTEADKAEILEFCEKYIGNLVEKQKAHKIAKKAILQQFILATIFTIGTIIITSTEIAEGKESLALQRRCLNASDAYLVRLRTKYQQALDFLQTNLPIIGKNSWSHARSSN